MAKQSIIWSSQRGNPLHGFPMSGMESHQKQDIHILTTHQRKIKHHLWFPLKGLPPLRQIPTNNLQIYSTTTDSGIIINQTTTQKDYPMYSVACSAINLTKGISKSTALKQSGNWDMWWKFLTHGGSEENYWTSFKMEPVQHWYCHSQNLFEKPVCNHQENQILHGTVKDTISDVYASFRTTLWSNPTLDASVQKFLTLQR